MIKQCPKCDEPMIYADDGNIDPFWYCDECDIWTKR